MRKNSFKRIIGQLHLYLGLISGLVVFIVAVTGCLWVFQDELSSVFYKQRKYVEVPENKSRVPISMAVQAATEALNNEHKADRMNIPTAEDESIYVEFRTFNTGKENGKKPIFYGDYMESFYRVYVNPYNGQVIKVENKKWEFFTVVLWLHMSLLLEYSIGHLIVGIAVLIFIVLLITGLILWWPKKNKRARQQRLWFQWKSTTRWKRKNFDLHNILGFYASFIALILAITGLVFAFEWVHHGIEWLANGGKTIPHEKIEYNIEPNSEDALDKIVYSLSQNEPTALSYFVSMPKKEDSPLSATTIMAKSGFRSYIRYGFNPFTGEQLYRKTFDDYNNGEKAMALNFPIHVGAILGFPGKVLAFFTSLICASLPVTGFLIWWGRRKKSNQTRPKSTKL